MDDEDARYLGELLAALADVSAWAARTGSAAGYVDPAPGGAMRGDDKRAHPYGLSHAAWHTLGHAVDHLCCLRVLVGDGQSGPYVRSVLASAGGTGERLLGGVDALASRQD